MKKMLLILAIVVTATGFKASAQDESAAKTPKWISDKGYWVLEDNKKGNSFSVINFYNNENQLVYREKLIGTSLNINKKKTLMKLKDALDASIVAWEEKHTLREDEAIVAKVLK
ncbi:hypothetical protein [Pinibacter soli]|uniref:Uncharacterized protein n=1 Tax=Pinibacter soli TaxID=3044211 RepID=A0ABT6RHA9_9BACT|nr:hypothetical protein [Pinibacter soli]MDI3321954.1 hypothetical protein [Pinibacter soli]